MAGRGGTWRGALVAGAVLLTSSATAAFAQISDDAVRIGVLNDQSGLYADLGGPGSVIAAQMAVEDFGGKVLGKPVEIVYADHQNKAHLGARLPRQSVHDRHGGQAIHCANP